MNILHLTRALIPGLLGSATLAVCAVHAQPDPPRAPQPSPPADTSPLVQEADLNAPVAKVWEVFSTDAGMRSLGVAQARVDFRVGGKMLSHYDPKGVIGDEGTIENTIIAYEPMRMVAFRITRPPKGFPFMEAYKNTWSVATLTDLGNERTRLRLAMMGYTADPESQRMRAFFDSGNAWVMRHLKAAVEGGGGAAIPSTAPPPAAALAGADPLAPIVAEAVVEAPPAEVWRCWTTSDGIRSFLTDAKVELRIGGPFEIYFTPEAPEGKRGSEGCVILSYEPTNMLSFSWNAPPQFPTAREKRTWIVLRIDPDGAHASRVTLRQMGFAEQAAADPAHAEEWAQVRAYFHRAWPSVLTALQERFRATAKP